MYPGTLESHHRKYRVWYRQSLATALQWLSGDFARPEEYSSAMDGYQTVLIDFGPFRPQTVIKRFPHLFQFFTPQYRQLTQRPQPAPEIFLGQPRCKLDAPFP